MSNETDANSLNKVADILWELGRIAESPKVRDKLKETASELHAQAKIWREEKLRVIK